MKTAESIEAQSAENKPANKRKGRGDFSRIAKWAWKPGQSGNPGGRKKADLAKVIAQAVFESNPELIYKAYSKLLAKGSAYGFQVVSDRAYGKLTETKELIHRYEDEPDGNIQERIDAILSELGLKSQIDALRGTEGTEGGASTESIAPEATDVLPGNRPVKA